MSSMHINEKKYITEFLHIPETVTYGHNVTMLQLLYGGVW